MWTNFYDDFVTFSWDEDAERTGASIELLFDLLGWDFARDGEKALAFDQFFGALGIHVGLSNFDRGFVEFSNTEKRKLELKELISSILEAGFLSLPDSLKLRGRLQFAEGQLFGRIGKLCLKEITSHAFSSGGGKLGSRLKQLLTLFMTQSLDGPPKRICGMSASCSFIFTDACYEPGRVDWQCGLGGIIYNSHGAAVQAFSCALSPDQIASLGGFVTRKQLSLRLSFLH